MKKLVFITALVLTISNLCFSQCNFSGTPLTQVGSIYTFCIDNSNTITTPIVNSGQFITVNVVKGFTYTFSIGNVFDAGRNENLTILNSTTNANVAPAAFSAGASGTSLTWNASLTGEVKVLVSSGSCVNDNSTGGIVTMTLNSVGNTQDVQTAFGIDQWIGHVYNWTGTAPPGGFPSPTTPPNTLPFAPANYVGYFNVPTESFSQNYGGNTACFPVLSNGINATNIYTETFAVRYRLQSTKVGCYLITFTGDDGIRVYVDGVKIFDEWKQQAPTGYNNVLVYLNGNSTIVFDYYENGGQNVTNFSINPFSSNPNTISPTTITGCSDVVPGIITGSSYTYNGATVNPSITYQWQISTDNVTFTNIIGATAKDYTPTAISTTTVNNRYYRRIVTATATNSTGCTFISNVTTLITNLGIPIAPTSISGNITQCPSTINQVYSTALVPNALNYNWTVPTGWTITSGNGTNSITVTSGAVGQNGSITVNAANGCGSSANSSLAVSVLTNTIAGTVTSNQTICNGSTPSNLTLSGNNGAIQWQTSSDNLNFSSIIGQTANTLAEAVIGNLTATKYFRSVVTNGCTTLNSNTVTITVNPTSVAGTISSNQTICSGTAPAPLSLTGNTGTIQWQVSTNNTTFTNIGGATSSTLTLAALTANRYYRAIITSGVCTAVTTNTVTIVVTRTSLSGTASSSQTLCLGTTPANLILTGNRGTIQWQSSTNNVTFTNIIGATTNTLTASAIGVLTVTRYFRAIVTNGICSSATSNTVTITINPSTVSGTISANQTICSGTIPSALTLAGNTGTIQWQSSTDNITFSNITSATTATLTLAALTATRYYRAVIKSGVCTAMNTNTVTITVTPLSVAGTVTGTQTVCLGTIPNNLTLTGNTGTIQWQSSSDNTTFTNISGATTTTLLGSTIGTLTATTYFKAIITSGVCTSATTNTVTITVNPTSSPVAGTISSNQTICSGSIPTALTLAGQTGTIQWQLSTNNSTFTNITSATTTTLTLAALTAARYYRAVISNGSCPTVITNTVTITVNPISVAGTISSNQTICSGSIPNPLTLTGNTGTIQWQSSLNNSTFTNSSGATSATFALAALTQTTYYRAIITSGLCTSATTNTVTITVNATSASVAGSISSNQAICAGSTPAALVLTGNTGTIQWQSSANNSTFVSMSGENSATLTLTAIPDTTYYRVLTTNGTCPAATTNTVAINVNQNAVPGTISNNQTLCSGTIPTPLLLTGNNGTIQWQSSLDNLNFTSIIGASASTLVLPALNTTTYYRAQSTSGVCPVATSNTVTVTIGGTSIWNGTSWDTTPTGLTSLVFNGNYTSTTDLVGCICTVNSGNVVISSGFDMTLNGILIVNSGNLTFENNSNLLQNTNVTNIGNINYKRNSVALKRQDYTLWSAPVAGQNVFNFSPLTLPTRFYNYNSFNNTYVAISSPASETFETGKGYLIRVPNNFSATVAASYNGVFAGIPNNGTISFPIIDGGSDTFRFTGSGNPYPSAIRIADLITLNSSNIEGTLWFWRKTNDDTNPVSYSTCTSVGCTLNNGQTYTDQTLISAGQGFLVKAKAGANSINFTNAIRSSQNVNQFFKSTSSETNRYWLELKNSSNVSFGQKLIAYVPEATMNYDDGKDGIYFNDSPTAITSIIEDKELIIQARPSFEDTDIVPLNFKTNTANTYSIAVVKKEGVFNSQSIYLKDNELNAIQDITNTPYLFTSLVGNFAERFQLVYQMTSLGNNDQTLENAIKVYTHLKSIYVNTGNENIKSIQIFDLTGRLLITKNDCNCSDETVKLNIAKQVLLVKVTTSSGIIKTVKVLY